MAEHAVQPPVEKRLDVTSVESDLVPIASRFLALKPLRYEDITASVIAQSGTSAVAEEEAEREPVVEASDPVAAVSSSVVQAPTVATEGLTPLPEPVEQPEVVESKTKKKSASADIEKEEVVAARSRRRRRRR